MSFILKPEQASPFPPLPFSNFLTTTIWSATATSYHPFVCLSAFSVHRTVATSLVPLQTPMMQSCQLYPGCYMTTKQVSRHALLVNTSVYAHFQHRLFALTRLLSLVQVLQLCITHLQMSVHPLFLIVHHKECFHAMQHKVVCKLSLQIVCGRPILFLVR